MFGAAGLRVRLPLLRDPLVPQLRVRRARPRRGGADPRARADARARRHARAPRRRRRAGALLRPRQALPGARRDARARRAARSTSRRSSCSPRDATPTDRDRPADRDHAGGRPPVALRPRGLALPQPAASDRDRHLHAGRRGDARPRDLREHASGLPLRRVHGRPCSFRRCSFALAFFHAEPDDLRHGAVQRLREHERHVVERRERARRRELPQRRRRCAARPSPACRSPAASAAAPRAAHALRRACKPTTFGTSTSFTLQFAVFAGPRPVK